ncbi:MAG: thioredoxin fold domain-containing protein [Gammaproteobacteria bacterium]|jgi:thioredoxin-related protein
MSIIINRLALFFAVISLVGMAHAAEEGGLSEGMVNPGYHEQPAWFKQSFLDIRDDVAEAAAHHKRVMLYFYQDGCPYCKKLLEDNFGQKSIADKTRKYFDVIAINMWGDRDVTGFDGKSMTEKQFAVSQKIMFTPTLVMLNAKGQTVLRINGYFPPHKFNVALDYAGRHLEGRESFRSYLAKVSPEPATGKLHVEPWYLHPPYDFSKLKGGKPLVVMFEQKACADCDELHLDILKRPESVKLLRRYDVAVLDMWADTPVTTPSGKRTTAARWAKSLQIGYTPSLVFFDASGQEVFRTGAYLKAFHMQSVLDYVASGAYRKQPEFQRYIDTRADALRARGVTIDLMK